MGAGTLPPSPPLTGADSPWANPYADGLDEGLLNQVDFSWANTQIDPNTIVFRVIPRVEAAGEAEQSPRPRPNRST